MEVSGPRGRESPNRKNKDMRWSAFDRRECWLGSFSIENVNELEARLSWEKFTNRPHRLIKKKR